jgi:tetratricopeptide (TPR) repeat protein
MAALSAVGFAATAHAAAQPARTPAATPAATPKLAPLKSAEELAKAEKDRLANLKKALAEAASYWTELIKRYPESPRCEQAFYNLGVIYCECEQWKEAGETLDKFVRGYPNSPLGGDAYIRLIDIAFERRFDLKLADQLADASQKWIAVSEGNSANAPAMPALWRTPPSPPGEDQAKSTTYNLRLRAIFAAYLSEKYDKAKQLLAAAGPLEPTDGRIDAQKVQKVGLFFLQKAILAQKPVWNVDVLAKAETDPQRTALKLADLYL